MIIERRLHKRYIVTGRAELQMPTGKTVGEIVSVGGGGLLMLCNTANSLGTNAEVSFTVQGHPGQLRALARVVRTEEGVLGVNFLEEPEGLQDLLLSLETEFVLSLISPVP